MNFGGDWFGALGFVVLAWAVPIGLMIWFVRTLSAMASALREIADRLGTLEQASERVRTAAPPNVSDLETLRSTIEFDAGVKRFGTLLG